MANTPNFALYKPSRADSGVEVDVSLTDNFVKIDTELKTNKDGLDTHKADVNAHASDKITHADGSVKTTLDNHEERLTSGEVAQADHETRISSNETTVADHETRITGVEGKADDIDNRVTDIETLGLSVLAPNLEGRLATVESDVEGFLAPATFDAMDSQSYTFDEYRIGYVENKLAQCGINVRSFGAKGDGVTDDTLSIKQAILKAVQDNVNTIEFPSGTYIIDPSNPIYMPEGFSFVGINGKSIVKADFNKYSKNTSLQYDQKRRNSLIVLGDPSTETLYTTPKFNFYINGLVIDGSCSESSNYSAFNGMALGDYYHIGFGIAAQFAENITLTNCEIKNCLGSGISLRQCKNYVVTGNHVHHNGQLPNINASQNGISVSGNPTVGSSSEGHIISNNIVHDNKEIGIMFAFNQGLIIANNQIYRNGQKGIEGDSQNASTDTNIDLPGDLIIQSNYIHLNGQEGIGITCSNNQKIIISNNIIKKNYLAGVDVIQNSNASVIINGNIIERVGYGNPDVSNVTHGINIKAMDVIISDNSVDTVFTGNGISITNGEIVKIANNIIKSTNNNSILCSNCSKISISDNEIKTAVNRGIYILNDTIKVIKCSIRSNYFDAMPQAILYKTTLNTNVLTIVNNIFYDVAKGTSNFVVSVNNGTFTVNVLKFESNILEIGDGVSHYGRLFESATTVTLTTVFSSKNYAKSTLANYANNINFGTAPTTLVNEGNVI